MKKFLVVYAVNGGACLSIAVDKITAIEGGGALLKGQSLVYVAGAEHPFVVLGDRQELTEDCASVE